MPRTFEHQSVYVLQRDYSNTDDYSLPGTFRTKAVTKFMPDARHLNGWTMVMEVPKKADHKPASKLDMRKAAFAAIAAFYKKAIQPKSKSRARQPIGSYVAWIAGKTPLEQRLLKEYADENHHLNYDASKNRVYPSYGTSIRQRVKQFEARNVNEMEQMDVPVNVQWNHSSNGSYDAVFEIDDAEYHVHAHGPCDGGGRVSVSFHSGRWMSENAMNPFAEPLAFRTLLECVRLIVAKQQPYKLYVGSDFYPADVSRQSRPIREELAKAIAKDHAAKVITNVREHRDWSVTPIPGQKPPMSRTVEYCVKFPTDIGAGIR